MLHQEHTEGKAKYVGKSPESLGGRWNEQLSTFAVKHTHFDSLSTSVWKLSFSRLQSCSKNNNNNTDQSQST